MKLTIDKHIQNLNKMNEVILVNEEKIVALKNKINELELINEENNYKILQINNINLEIES